MTSILIGGYYVQHVPTFIAWIKYLSISYYTYQLLVGSQYESTDTYPCSEGQCLVTKFPSIKHIELHSKDQVIGSFVLRCGIEPCSLETSTDKSINGSWQSGVRPHIMCLALQQDKQSRL